MHVFTKLHLLILYMAVQEHKGEEADFIPDCLFVCLVFNGTFSTNRLYRAIGVCSISRRAGEKHKTQTSCN